MALADAVLEIVEEMEADAQEAIGDDAIFRPKTIQRWARALRAIVKAAEGSAPAAQPMPAFNPMLMSPAVQHATMIEKARQDVRKEKAERGLADVGLGPDGVSTVYLIGGPFDGDSVACPAEVPLGQRTNMGTAEEPLIYVMQADHKAHFSEEETVKAGGKVPEKKSTILVP